MTAAKPSRSALAVQDKLDDLMTGFEFWKQAKINGADDLTILDEMLIRWVEASPESRVV